MYALQVSHGPLIFLRHVTRSSFAFKRIRISALTYTWYVGDTHKVLQYLVTFPFIDGLIPRSLWMLQFHPLNCFSSTSFSCSQYYSPTISLYPQVCDDKVGYIHNWVFRKVCVSSNPLLHVLKRYDVNEYYVWIDVILFICMYVRF